MPPADTPATKTRAGVDLVVGLDIIDEPGEKGDVVGTGRVAAQAAVAGVPDLLDALGVGDHEVNGLGRPVELGGLDHVLDRVAHPAEDDQSGAAALRSRVAGTKRR